jgi:hypothetical protein
MAPTVDENPTSTIIASAGSEINDEGRRALPTNLPMPTRPPAAHDDERRDRFLA